jgi:hypothetical protein
MACQGHGQLSPRAENTMAKGHGQPCPYVHAHAGARPERPTDRLDHV